MKISEQNKREIYEYFSFFDDLGMALLVTDPHTGEVLFANNSMNALYGLDDNPVGRTCHEVYDGNCSQRCKFCPIPQLLENPGTKISWERYSSNMKKWLSNTDVVVKWGEKQKIHVQYVVDITRVKNEDVVLEQQKKQRELMASITHDFTRPKDNVYEQIHNAFKKVGMFFEFDRILLMQLRKDAPEAFVECAWCRADTFKPARTRKGNAIVLDFELQNGMDHKYISCDNILKDSRYESLKETQTKSFLTVPVQTSTKETRWISFETCINPKPIKESHIHVATVLGGVVGNALNRAADIDNIKQSKKQAQLLFDLTPFACVLFDENSEIVDCNVFAFKMFGFENKQEFIKTFSDYHPKVQPNGESSNKMLSSYLDKTAEMGTTTFFWTQHNKAKEEIPLQITTVRIPWDKGYHTAFYARDLRKEMNEEKGRRKAEKQTQLMLDSTPLICSIWDENLNMLDCNLEAVHLLELNNKSEFIGNFLQFTPPFQADGEPSKEKVYRLLTRVLETGQERFEWEYQIRAGELLPVETTLIRVKWDEGFRILAYSRDLRDVKEAEKKEKKAEKRTTLMLDSLPMASFLISRNHELIDCNMEAVRMFQVNSKELLIHAFLEDFSPDYQLDGQPSKEKFTKLIDMAFEEGHATFDWIHKVPNGDIIPAEIILVHVHWKEDEDLVCAYARDLRHVKRTEGELKKRTLLLETVNKIAERLLPIDSSIINNEIQVSMKYLAQSVNADSARIWQNIEHEGKLCYQLMQSWPSEYEAARGEIRPYEDLPFWKEMIFSNRTINGPVAELPEVEKNFMKAIGTKSVLSIPLTVLDKVWGFITFDDNIYERTFAESEEYALRSGSTLLASAMIRNSTTEELISANSELTEKRNMLSAVNRVAELILASEKEDFSPVMQKALCLIGESVKADRAALWQTRVDKDGVLYATRLPGWRDGVSLKESTGSSEVQLYDYIPQWEHTNTKQDLEIQLDETNEKLRGLAFAQGGQILSLIPLYLQERFWGLVALARPNKSLGLTKEERNIIRSGSLMIAEAVSRNILFQNLQEVKTIAATDALTGLLNRTSFIPKAESIFSNSSQASKPNCVMFLDIDHFKKVNDTYGHAFGDIVLIKFAEILRTSLRPNDLCARYGGEEFVIMLANGTEEMATKIAKRVAASVKATQFLEHPNFSFTVSIGLMAKVPKNGDTLQNYIENADTALYEAKNTGRNKLVHFKETAPLPILC